MTVSQVQMLGDRLHVYLRRTNTAASWRRSTATRKIKSKDTLPIFVDISRALFFAPGDGPRFNARSI